jgi:hypothetical protein
MDVAGFGSLLRDWMAAQPDIAELDTLISDGKDAAWLDRRNRLWRSEVHHSSELTATSHEPLKGMLRIET